MIGDASSVIRLVANIASYEAHRRKSIRRQDSGVGVGDVCAETVAGKCEPDRWDVSILHCNTKSKGVIVYAKTVSRIELMKGSEGNPHREHSTSFMTSGKGGSSTRREEAG
jgi:hypothetical protein